MEKNRRTKGRKESQTRDWCDEELGHDQLFPSNASNASPSFRSTPLRPNTPNDRQIKLALKGSDLGNVADDKPVNGDCSYIQNKASAKTPRTLKKNREEASV